MSGRGGGAGGEPGVDGVGVSGSIGRVGDELGGFDEEAVGRGARVGRGKVGLRLEDDLEGGLGEWGDEAGGWVHEELVG